MAQSMGYEEIAKLTHSMEAALALLRSGRIKAEKNTVNLLFKSVDTLGALIEEVKSGKAKKVKVAPLVERYEKITSAAPKKKREPVDEKKANLELENIDHSSPSLSEVQTVRVPLTQLDSLMDVTGELVINRIRLAQVAQTIEDKSLEETVDQISRLTFQLQDQMMQVRLVPLEYIFTPYPRMVRDMAVNQKKEVDFLIKGSQIGLDRSLQDEINESLLHLLKNAVTHGIEEPEERKRLKKPRRGTIRLTARRERNFVVIELSDDGRGIDIEEIKEVSLKTGLITKEELSTLTPKEIIKLITYPGYSRAKKVTEAAGRGVGLNAARIKVESFGGILDIDTRPNEGTTIFIKLPLTMAIVQAMLVGITDETYCIPLSYITETIKVSPQQIKTVEQQEMISYRDEVLPLIRLREKFGFPSSRSQPPDSETTSRVPAIPVVVVELVSKKAGLVVDSLLGQQEVVIKPLTGILKEIKGASGTTILGTGKAALIVDVGLLLKREVML
jgi:two-component system chemotaxis sensor kinase CheA